MASAIPYDPDDFENNNPFAEPEDNAPPPHTLPAVPASGQLPPSQHQPQRPDQKQELPPTPDQQQGTLVKEELKRLIPERFVTKHSVKLTLREIEPNRPENPILRFDAHVVGLPGFRQSTYLNVRRTYTETLKFNRYLVVSNLEVFVPILPSPQTSYPTGGEDENKQLMYVWQEWLDRVARNPILVRDEELVFFVENDFGYAVINAGKKTSVASGFMRKTLKQLAVPYDPYTELADFRPVVKAAYLSGQKLHRALEKNHRNERHLASLMAELTTKLKGLAHFEASHPGMKNMWHKLASIVQIESEIALIRSISDMGSLGDGIHAMAADLYEIKEALTNRHLIMRELTHAQAQTKAKHLHATKIKNRSSLDPLKVDEALMSLEQATKAEESLHKQVKRISGEMMFEKTETVAFLEQKFQRMLKSFSLSRVDQHRKLLKNLENIRLDVRIIDAKGGLSRLNRDNLTQMKHNLTQSQAANGDSWSSRTFRSLATEQADKEERNRRQQDDVGAVDAKQAASVLGVTTF